jgi:hypothetical protein
MRSFEIVEDKILESDFFLERLKECKFNMQEARFYFSAFLSSSRSITFCLQASMKDTNGFDKWYIEKQVTLKNNELAKFFLQARNDSQKVGLYHLNS